MKDHRTLDVWPLVHTLVRQIYLVTQYLPSTERFGLTRQLRGSAVAIATSLIEGSREIERDEFVRYVLVAESRAAEVEYLLRLAADLAGDRSIDFDFFFDADMPDDRFRVIRAHFKKFETEGVIEPCSAEESARGRKCGRLTSDVGMRAALVARRTELTRDMAEEQCAHLLTCADRADKIKRMLYGLRERLSAEHR